MKGRCRFCKSSNIKASWGMPGYYFCNDCKDGDKEERLLPLQYTSGTPGGEALKYCPEIRIVVKKVKLSIDSSNPCGEIALNEESEHNSSDNGLTDY